MPATIPLPQLIPQLLEEYAGEVSYPRLYRASVEGRFPVLWIAGRLYLDPEHKPAVAAYFKMTPKVPPSPKARTKVTTAG
jgi:hypothetical protein